LDSLPAKYYDGSEIVRCPSHRAQLFRPLFPQCDARDAGNGFPQRDGRDGGDGVGDGAHAKSDVSAVSTERGGRSAGLGRAATCADHSGGRRNEDETGRQRQGLSSRGGESEDAGQQHSPGTKDVQYNI